jgi:hypothetical protein
MIEATNSHFIVLDNITIDGKFNGSNALHTSNTNGLSMTSGDSFTINNGTFINNDRGIV